jgi:carboxymethylenebutenolidase
MTERVDIVAGDGGTFPGHLSMPPARADGRPHPGVVVLHEIFGVNDDIRRIADRFAAEGYAAIAPELYHHGNTALCLTRVLASAVSGDAERKTLADIDAARRHLMSREEVDDQRIAVAGFCLGGGFALLFAAKGGVKAASVNYGMVPKAREKLSDVCPVVASYGSHDKQFTPQAARLESHLEALGVPHDVKVYDGVGHSFMNKDNAPAWMLRINTRMQAGYHEAESEDSWKRIIAFFDEHVTA